MDENVLSRQLFTIGKDAQMKIMNTKVLINGLNGLGSEIAKNIILMSVKSVALREPKLATESDLGTNFFLRQEHIGKQIDESTVGSFQELNTSLKVSVEKRDMFNEELYKDYDVIVVCELYKKQEIIQINELCRKHNVKFVYAINRGVFSLIFNDFGNDFIVYDTNGEQPRTYTISGLFDNTFQLIEDNFCDMTEGDEIKIEEIIGMEELNYSQNGNKTYKITKRTGTTIEIGNLSELTKGNYVKGGIITEVKTPITLHMKSLKERLEEAGEISFTNSTKFDRLYATHGLFHALMIYYEKFNKTPATHSEEDYVEFKKIVDELHIEVDEKISKIFCYTNNGFISPLDTVIGGIAAQEVLKAGSGKYTPYNQFCVYDCIEILPEKYLEMKQEEFIDNGRYSGQICLLGKELQNKIENSSMFLIGAGAIGCEVLKTWAMMGIATKNGMIHVTDNDNIEKSNLSRQFLFRNNNVGQSKSATAAQAIREMNPSIHVTEYTLRVGEATENVFNEKFYSQLNAVTTALDNVQARIYVDNQCLRYQLPMIEAGTTGTKGNTQTIVPFITQSYSTGSVRDPAEKGIPLCTLHNFPSNIDHTIQWARDRFEGWFKNDMEPVKCYNEQGEVYLESQMKQGVNTMLTTLDLIIENGIEHIPKTEKDCIEWIRKQYDINYINTIQQLIDLNPEDSITDEGIPFWHAPKRFPHILPFTKDNEVAKSFIINGTYLRAGVYNIPITMNDNEIIEYAITLPQYKNIPKKIEEDDVDVVELLKMKKEKVKSSQIVKVNPVEFEKDDDTNHHIAFITAASNLRAENYCIEPADFMKTKFIAGKIIPAMITTTAVVSGLQCVEYYKVMQNKPLEAYHNSYLNLAIGYMDGTEPEKVVTEKICDGIEVTIWNPLTLYLDKSMTIEDIANKFEEKYPYEFESLVINGKLFYASYMPTGPTNKKKVLAEMYKEKFNQEIESSLPVVITVASKEEEDDDDNFDDETPSLNMTFKF